MRRALAAVALLTLLLTGCSDDSDDDSAAGTTTTVASTTSISVDTNFTGEGSEQFCQLAGTYRERLDELGTTDPTQLRALATEAETAIKEAQEVAPEEIKGDVQLVAGASISFFEVLAAANYDLTKVSPDALSGLQRPEVQASTQRLTAYTQNVCGLTTTTAP